MSERAGSCSDCGTSVVDQNPCDKCADTTHYDRWVQDNEVDIVSEYIRDNIEYIEELILNAEKYETYGDIMKSKDFQRLLNQKYEDR